MQTATTEVEDLNKTNKQTVRILLDTGNHTTYITEELAKILQLKVNGSETLTVYTFNSTKPSKLQTHVTELRLLTKEGSYLHRSEGQRGAQDNWYAPKNSHDLTLRKWNRS